ncbi:hypothetical protein [Aliidiomarina soli]|uniref:Uncharacterized protein n=1 Tax=Aliidiomarina soli TaxID=1928574 RepID=A0A432WLL0_9GAMM|nr:hypothetical protein [Aliidiomarina soli]RUO34700.1 hypothetical protein CWE14_01475 [Aliidiomarina soli]
MSRSEHIPRYWLSRALISTVSSAVILFLFALYPLATMSAWGFALVAAAASYLVYWHLADVMLLRRRAYLGFVTQTDSHWRQRLWSSVWVQLLTAFASVAVALAALSAAARLSWPEWAVLGASILTFQLIQRLVRPSIERHITSEHSASVLLRLSHLLNMVLVVIAMLAVHLWLTEVPDTRHLSVAEVMAQAYQVESARADVQLIGWLLGINAALYSLFWHAIQLLSLGAAWWLTLAVWLVVMLGIAVQVSFIWLVLLGSYAWLNRFLYVNEHKKTYKRAHLSWLFVVIAAGIGWFALELNSENAQSWFQQNEQARQQSRETVDPCAPERLAAAETAVQGQSERVRSEQEQAALLQIEQDIDRIVDDAYANIGQAADDFLDWNFSLLGQYTQLAYLMRGSFGEQGFNELMAEQINSFVALSQSDAMLEAENSLNAALLRRIEQGARAYQRSLGQELEAEGLGAQRFCLALQPVSVDVPELMQKSGVGAGVAPGLLLMSRALAPGSAVAARSGMRRMFAAIMGRLTARAGTAGSAATVGSVCGPGCSLIAGGLVWLGTDLVINYGDEKLNRDAMREALLLSLHEQRDTLKAQLNNEAAVLVLASFAELEARQLEQFNLYRELQRQQ